MRRIPRYARHTHTSANLNVILLTVYLPIGADLCKPKT